MDSFIACKKSTTWITAEHKSRAPLAVVYLVSDVKASNREKLYRPDICTLYFQLNRRTNVNSNFSKKLDRDSEKNRNM
jgi:hypothetical protein